VSIALVIARFRPIMYSELKQCRMLSGCTAYSHTISWRRLSWMPVALLVVFCTHAAKVRAQDSAIPGLIVAVPSSSGDPTGSSSSGTRPPSPWTSKSAATLPATRSKPKETTPRKSESAIRKSRPKRQTVSRKKHGVAVLVNDEPITHHEIDQRARLLGMNSRNIAKKARARFQALIKRESTSKQLRRILEKTIKENRGKSRDEVLAIFEKRKKAFAKRLQRQAVSSARASLIPAQRQNAQKELIEERLKLQEAKRLNVLATLAEVDTAVTNVAKRNKTTTAKFLGNLKSSGVSAQTFKDRIRASISWASVIRREYGRKISVSMADVDSHLAKTGGSSDIKLNLHKITLKLPNSLNQSSIAMRLREGERLKAKFSGCRSTKILARDAQNAVFKDLGKISAAKISEPARSLLMQARDNEMLPPLTKQEGVVLYAVCGRDADSAKKKARSVLQRREFSIMQQRHLADIKRDAHIEYR